MERSPSIKFVRDTASAYGSSITGLNTVSYQHKEGNQACHMPLRSPTRQVAHCRNGLQPPLACPLIPKPNLREVHYEGHIAALEDKIVQRATAAVLNAIYEEDFLGFSYGFRPGRSPHDAMDALAVGITTKKVNFILDADVRSFFDSVSKDLVRFVGERIGDKRI